MNSEDSTNQEKAFLDCYEKYSDAIFRFCYYKTGDRELSLDLTQETFIKTWEYIRSGKSVGNLRAFLYKIAGNAVIDFYRKKKALSLDQLGEVGFDPTDTHYTDKTTHQREVEEVKKVIDTLDPKYRDVLYFKLIEELSISEIADSIGISENATSVRIHRGIKLLQDKLNYEN
ncbi:MAG: sigma-70 family RNA polymerase sigma factor [bacterium]